LKIGAIRLDRMRLPLDSPFYAAWDPVPRRHFDADGYLTVPAAPGLGAQIDHAAVTRYTRST
jgi:L-alanine-DL-glutamate epimerase-like enolase superfamily enzyme